MNSPAKIWSLTVNADEAVAIGAAFLAAKLHNTADKPANRFLLIDVIPKSLGIEALQDEENGIARIKVNNLLGEFVLSGIAAARAGQPNIKVTFTVDTDGILVVIAVEEGSTNDESTISIDNITAGRMNGDDIQRMKDQEIDFRRQQEMLKENADAKNSFIAYCNEMQRMLRENEDIQKKCNAELKWLEENEDETATAYKERHEALKTVCQPFVAIKHPAADAQGIADVNDDANAQKKMKLDIHIDDDLL